MKTDYAVLLNRRRFVHSRNISFGRRSLTLICPECGKAAEYMHAEDNPSPGYGILDDGNFDDYMSRHEYFVASNHAVCPHCSKDFTVTGYLMLSHYHVGGLDFTQEEAVRVMDAEGKGYDSENYLDDTPILICPACRNAAPYQYVDWLGEAEDGYGNYYAQDTWLELLPRDNGGMNVIEGEAMCPCCGHRFDINAYLSIDQFCTFKRHLKRRDFFLEEAEEQLRRQGSAARSGFMLTGGFALPAAGKFSLSNRRRCRP